MQTEKEAENGTNLGIRTRTQTQILRGHEQQQTIKIDARTKTVIGTINKAGAGTGSRTKAGTGRSRSSPGTVLRSSSRVGVIEGKDTGLILKKKQIFGLTPGPGLGLEPGVKRMEATGAAAVGNTLAESQAAKVQEMMVMWTLKSQTWCLTSSWRALRTWGTTKKTTADQLGSIGQQDINGHT